MDSSLACYEGKLVYVANLRAPSEKAHVLQSFKMCEAFRRLGLDVELTHPRRRNTAAMEGVDALSYYDVECPFRLAPCATAEVGRQEQSRIEAGRPQCSSRQRLVRRSHSVKTELQIETRQRSYARDCSSCDGFPHSFSPTRRNVHDRSPTSSR